MQGISTGNSIETKDIGYLKNPEFDSCIICVIFIRAATEVLMAYKEMGIKKNSIWHMEIYGHRIRRYSKRLAVERTRPLKL